MRLRTFRLTFSITLGAAIIILPASTRAADVLTQHNNNARTGATLDETVLNTNNVNPVKFGKKWTLYADGQVVAQPLYIGSLAVDTSANPNAPPVRGTFNAVIIATMHNTVYVYDADKENRGPDGRTIPLWATWLGQPRPGSKEIDMWSTNDPEWGILSTPVVSDDKTTLYVVAWHGDGPGEFRYKLHALDLRNGLDRMPAVPIGPSSIDNPAPCQDQSVFNPCRHKQRAALLLSKGLLYIAFGGDGNRGAMFVFDAQTLTQKGFWSPTPTGKDGGIWQSGQGPAADADGNIYLMIGNGTFDANAKNFGSSFVKLQFRNQNLEVKDFFTPCNFKFLNDTDLDVGSGGPLLVPVTPGRIVSGGKEGVLYSLPQANMGKHIPATGANCQNAAQVQQVLAFPPIVHGQDTHYGNIHGSPVYWNGPDTGRIYVWGENSALKAYRFSQGKLQDINNPKQSAFRPPEGMPGGMLTISANGNKAGTGILWAVVPLDGDANKQRGVKGIVLALDAQDVSRTLWTSEQSGQRDRLGLFAKFANPIVAAGKVFVVTYGDEEPLRVYNPGIRPTEFPKNYYVAVYGALDTPPPPVTIINQDRDDITFVRAVTSPLTLDTTGCTAVDPLSVDCTETLSRLTSVPSFHRLIVPANTKLTGCSLLRVTTASRNSGLQNSAGIGFWSASVVAGNIAPENSGLFVTKDRLKASGTAKFQNGDDATLHDFAGITNCQVAGAEAPGRVFKPYMQFASPDGKIFRNWDLAPNQLINSNTPQLDRSGDVLQH